jgi:hypothetical protein
MWLLVGELRRVIKRTSDTPGPKFQVQMLSAETMKSGEVRESIFTLGTDNPSPFEPFVGKQIAIEASPFARKDGSLGVSMADGAKIMPPPVSKSLSGAPT